MLRVRFSDEEWTTLQEQANAAGMTMSALVRDHLGRVSIRNREDERQRLIRLNRINANLNMIARWVNTYRDKAETIQVISHLIAIQRYIRDLAS
ncbi:plasmid mobilization protein [Bombella saccharophila]|uniref:plasmid mobilization protein n=1 Tax=Bombella saccharophila TaxID=2967338 RepID=UPI0038992D92